MYRSLLNAVASMGIGCALMAAIPDRAAAQAQPPAAPDQPAAPAKWSDTLKFSGYIEGGITGNPDSPHSGINFGQLYEDRANTPMLNQFSLVIERPLDPKATDYDFGFKFQPMFGSDARYTHSLGIFDRATRARYQLDLIEADVKLHLPWITDGGVDAMIGQFPSPMGAESIVPASNTLYSHSYSYYFGVTTKHTGAWTITHVNDVLDLYLGVDTGNQTTFGGSDNNGAIAGVGGFNLTFLGGNLTILGLSHFGPENPSNAGENFNVNGAFRYYNDITTTYKYSDDLSFITDLNFVKDDGFKATGFGVAQYATYVLNDWATLQARGEIWRDTQGFFVAAFPGNLDFVNALSGRRNNSFGVGSTTYSEITLGVNLKPPVPKLFEGALIRPELRYDNTLNGTKAYNDRTSDHQWTIAADFILPF